MALESSEEEDKHRRRRKKGQPRGSTTAAALRLLLLVTEKLGRKRPDKGSHTAASKIENKRQEATATAV